MSKPIVRRVKQDLYLVEWDNVRFGGSFAEILNFSEALDRAMYKAIAGKPEDEESK